MKKKIGILGGMGPEALSDMYMEICKYYQNKFGAKYDKDFPPMIMYSVPIPDVVEQVENEEKIKEMLIEAAITLEQDTCDFIVIACNSVQYLLSDIQSAVTVPVIGIAQTVGDFLKKKKFTSVGILSTETTIKRKVYLKTLSNLGIELIIPNKIDQEKVTNIIMQQLAGKITDKDKKELIGVTESLRNNGAQAVLIACTDLPLVITQENTTIPVINCTKVYSEEAARLSARN